MTNNPTAIALHEANILWPNTKLQCVVSVGTGRFERPEQFEDVEKISLRQKVEKFIQSATNTEGKQIIIAGRHSLSLTMQHVVYLLAGVHQTLQDLLPPQTYFRFNPYMSENFELDEIRDDKWTQMVADTRSYCHKNERKFNACAKQLQQPKRIHQRVKDFVQLNKDTYL